MLQLTRSLPATSHRNRISISPNSVTSRLREILAGLTRACYQPIVRCSLQEAGKNANGGVSGKTEEREVDVDSRLPLWGNIPVADWRFRHGMKTAAIALPELFLSLSHRRTRSTRRPLWPTGAVSFPVTHPRCGMTNVNGPFQLLTGRPAPATPRRVSTTRCPRQQFPPPAIPAQPRLAPGPCTEFQGRMPCRRSPPGPIRKRRCRRYEYGAHAPPGGLARWWMGKL